MPSVFISHSSDIDFCRRLKSDLEANSITAWLDESDRDRTNNWDGEITRALCGDLTTHMLYVETPDSAREESVCLNEINMAIDCHVPILRILLRDTPIPPLRVNRLTWIDFRQPDNYGVGLNELIDEIERTQNKRFAIQLSPLRRFSIRPLDDSQIEAAHDQHRFIRLVAGPGTGKSQVLVERVHWLLHSEDASPKSIAVVSFTRAASKELREKIRSRFADPTDSGEGPDVSAGTFHSLALKFLRRTGKLGAHPVTPRLLDTWECEHLFDEEFKEVLSHNHIRSSLTRCRDIRSSFETQWDTCEQHSGYGNSPVTNPEKQQFEEFVRTCAVTYSCVLPGELIRRCCRLLETDATVNAAEVLGIKHLIVDEYQDMNCTDSEFINHIATGGASVFVAGDDDQSIYSFRHAYPTGLQNFVLRYPDASKPMLSTNYRSATEILKAAVNFITLHPIEHRIEKELKSSQSIIDAGIRGHRHFWALPNASIEASTIAAACTQLINSGVAPGDIAVILRLSPDLLDPIKGALIEAGIPIDLSGLGQFINGRAGRFVYSILRIACDSYLEDYVAHRVLLSLLPKVTAADCVGIRQNLGTLNLDFLRIFYSDSVIFNFTGRQTNAIEHMRSVLHLVKSWTSEDTLILRRQEIAELMASNGYAESLQVWDREVAPLPDDATLGEVIDYLEASTTEEKVKVIEAISARLGLGSETQGDRGASRVKITTMHRMKGLDSHVVFIPGLERGFIPDERNATTDALVREEARLLYVSLTRARIATIVSYAKSRTINHHRGQRRAMSPFGEELGGIFVAPEPDGISTAEARAIKRGIDLMNKLNNSGS